MMRHFQITSDVLSYSGGVAAFNMPRVLKGNSRAAIIGIDVLGTSRKHAMQNLLRKLQVSSRNYVQNDPILLGLLVPSAEIIEDNSGGTAAGTLAAQTLPSVLVDNTGAPAADLDVDRTVLQAGIHTWAGGAATTDSITVTGILATDVIVATLVARNATETLVLAAHDVANGQIDLTLSANGADGTTLISYVVFRDAEKIDKNDKELLTQANIARTQLSTIRDGMATLAAAINGRGQGGSTHPYFPGTGIVLADGQVCGGIAVESGENIHLELEDLTAGSAELTQVVLHCVEFPTDCEHNGESYRAAWERFKGGEGEVLFVGDAHSYTAAFNRALTVEPRAMHGEHLRRLEVWGAMDNGSGALRENDFRALTVEVFTDNTRPAHNAGVPARSIIGHGGMRWPGATRVDMGARKGKSSVQVDAPAPTSGTNVLRLCHIFEGRPAGEQIETGSRAIS